jgi:hypothetical protein
MIFNTRETVKKKIGKVTVELRPLSMLDHEEMLDKINGASTVSEFKDMVKWAANKAWVGVEGLADDKGAPCGIERNEDGTISDSFLFLHPRYFLDQLASLILTAGGLEDDEIKK